MIQIIIRAFQLESSRAESTSDRIWHASSCWSDGRINRQYSRTVKALLKAKEKLYSLEAGSVI